MSTLAAQIEIWHEQNMSWGGNRRATIVVADGDLAEKVKRKAMRQLGWTTRQLNAEYPDRGIDITPVEVYETVDGALEACSWPFEEFK